jgi:excisionase family DNA binding protein
VSARESLGAGHRGAADRETDENRSGPFDRCFTVAQAAQVLGTSPETVRRLLHSGQIAYQQVSARRTVIRESALRAYLDAVSFGPQP